MINPFRVIVAAFKVQKEVSHVMSIKNGFLSSEFLATMSVSIATLWGAVQGFVPAPYNVVIPTVAIGVYTIARTALKIAQLVKSARAGEVVDPEEAGKPAIVVNQTNK